MRRFFRRLLPRPLGVRLFPVHGRPLAHRDRPLVRLAHLTDLHFCAGASARYSAGPAVLRHAVRALNAQDLDAVVFTGDLFDMPHRLEADAPAFAEIMRELRHPWYAALGNHDVEGRQAGRRRAYLAGILGDQGLSRSGTSWYHAHIGPGVHLVVLDSTDNGEEDYLSWRGYLSGRQLQWLDRTLGELSGEMVVVALHHPPVAPYPLMKALEFTQAAKRRLGRILARHPHAPVVLCGHFHMAGCLPFGHAGVLTGPGLIEHPHLYRIFEIRPERDLITFGVEEVHLPADEHADCGVGPYRLRSRLLGNLSHARSGHLVLPVGRQRPVSSA